MGVTPRDGGDLPSLPSFILAGLVLLACILVASQRRPKRDFVAVVEQTSVTKFKEFTLFRTKLEYVQAMCGLTGGVDDEGNVRTEPPPCCYDTARKEMWVAYYHEACIVHELCHVEGRKDCARVGL